LCECERLPHKQVNSKAQGSALTGGAREREIEKGGRERERRGGGVGRDREEEEEEKQRY